MPDDIAAFAVSCVIGLIWFDELWKFGFRCGDWIGQQVCKMMLGE